MDNLPPGCSPNDIPGNRPEDEAWDDLVQQISRCADAFGWDAATTQKVWKAGVSYAIGTLQCHNCGETLNLRTDVARAEDEEIQRLYPSTGGHLD